MELDFNSKFAECESYEQFYLELMDVTFKKLNIKCDPIVSVSIVDNRYIQSN